MRRKVCWSLPDILSLFSAEDAPPGIGEAGSEAADRTVTCCGPWGSESRDGVEI